MFDIFNMLKKDENHPVKQVTRETIIGDILDMDQSTAPYFMEIGMHCLGCPASRGESIEEACEVHGVDCDELLEKLNAWVQSPCLAKYSREESLRILYAIFEMFGSLCYSCIIEHQPVDIDEMKGTLFLLIRKMLA